MVQDVTGQTWIDQAEIAPTRIVRMEIDRFRIDLTAIGRNTVIVSVISVRFEMRIALTRKARVSWRTYVNGRNRMLFA